MVHLDLSLREVTELEELFKTTDDRRLRTRAQALLMTYRGRTQAEIAADLLVDERTVRRWLEVWRQRGLDGLRIRWAPGAAPRIGGALAQEVVDWVRQGPAACGLDRANWTSAELAEHVRRTRGVRVAERTMRSFCQRHGIRPYRPTYRFLRGDAGKQEQARQELSVLKNEARAGACVLLSQDEARFPMVPTLVRTLGVKGHRPIVGTRDNKDTVYAFASLNLLKGRLTTRLLVSEVRTRRRYGSHKTRHLQTAFAHHLRDVVRAYPASRYARVVLTIDNAPWHRGKPITDVLTQHPHLKLYRLPSYSPQLNVIERLWKLLRRRATHNRLFEKVADLRCSLRANLRALQAMPKRMMSLIESTRTRAKLPAA
jgi:transposase